MQEQLDAYSSAYTKLINDGFVYVFSIKPYFEKFQSVIIKREKFCEKELQRVLFATLCSSESQCLLQLKEYVKSRLLAHIEVQQQLLANEVKRVKEIMREHIGG